MEQVRAGLDTWRATMTCQKEVAAAEAAATLAKAASSKLVADGR